MRSPFQIATALFVLLTLLVVYLYFNRFGLVPMVF